MTDDWPLLISALAIFWSLVSFRRLPATRGAQKDRRMRSLCPWQPAVSGQSHYLSAKLTVVGLPRRRAPWSPFSAWQVRAGESFGARLLNLFGRRGHDRGSIHALSHALFRMGLLREPDWGLFVWDLEGVGAALRAVLPGVRFPGMVWRALAA